MAFLVIGDIHGCWVELQALLDKAGLRADDTILAVGDIVDRGPETPQVLDFFRNAPSAQVLMGNHERKHVRASRGEIQLSLSQRISEYQLAGRYPEEVFWMCSLPLFTEFPEAIVVHGYLEPDLPLPEQNPSVLCGTLGGARILHEPMIVPGTKCIRATGLGSWGIKTIQIPPSLSSTRIRFSVWIPAA
jgi:serine/threonine protein phosphatase 1